MKRPQDDPARALEYAVDLLACWLWSALECPNDERQLLVLRQLTDKTRDFTAHFEKRKIEMLKIDKGGPSS